jgi:hypothetical protein
MKLIRFMLLPALVFAALAAATTAAAVTTTPVMNSLDNPRGLTFGPEGALYVAESGRGGTGPCTVLRGEPACYGPTGRISRWWHGVQSFYATGLPSYVSPDSVTGPHDISMLGRGNAAVTIGWGENPALRATLPGVGNRFDRLARVPGSGKWRLEEDIGAYEVAANPDNGPIDSNAYGALVLPGRTLVTDAGGNDLLQVRPNGHISTLAVFPSRTTVPQHSSCVPPSPPFPPFPPFTDSVPTAVTLGPDGAYYVGELTGAPFCAENANVYRVVPGQPFPPPVYCGGFTTIIDLTWGPDGNLYVLQHSNGPFFFATPGNVVRVGPGCAKTDVSGPLNRPGGLAFGPDGALYVSVNSTSVGAGEVWRITP